MDKNMSSYLKFEPTNNMMGIKKMMLLPFLLILGLATMAVVDTSEIKHSIQVIHPGISLTDSVACTLVEVQEESGGVEFYMEVETVVCGSNDCRVDLIRVYWDELGNYLRIVLPPGVELEKTGGKAFNQEDYQKLDAILSRKESPLADLFKEEVVGTVAGEGVDALSGATIQLDKEAYIQGAVWTTYTLWHWVHGNTRQIIRNIRGGAHSLQQFLQFLERPDQYAPFAVEQLTRLENYDSLTWKAVLNATLGNRDLTKLSLAYWSEAPPTIFEEASLALIANSVKEDRLRYLSNIQAYPMTLPAAFYDQLAELLPGFDSYEEVHFTLRILEALDNTSPGILRQVMHLLKNDNFLIARRAYWMLVDQPVSAVQQRELEDFYQNNADKL